MHDSSMLMPSRTLRYSGSERPAWRMNHTGVCGVGSLRAARRKAESCSSGSVVGGGGHGPILAGQAASRVPGTALSA